MSWTRLREESEVQLAEPIEKRADLIVEKSTYSTTDVLMRLADKYGTQQIDFCGIDTDACVLQNAVGIFDRGLIPRVLSDLCASNGGEVFHQAALSILRRAIGKRQVLEVEA